MFITLTNNAGARVYVNMAQVVGVAPYDGEREGGPYGRCRSQLLYGDAEAIYVRETSEEVMTLAQPPVPPLSPKV